MRPIEAMICLLLPMFSGRFQDLYSVLSLESRMLASPDKAVKIYRGAVLERSEQEKYCQLFRQNKCFSWYEFTSASFSKQVVNKCLQNLDGQCKVMFTIVLDYSEETLLQAKDFSSSSEFPEEEEVVLAPGSIFQITSIHDDYNMTKINLKLVPFS
jgi:hypothetical protein